MGVWNLVSHVKGKQRLRVFEGRVLKKIFGLRRKKYQKVGKMAKFRAS
jgi:hypothetical protein